MPNYKEKIHKLLALAESSNENEAKAALLKARELMAEHKLLESDCMPENSKVRKELVGIKTAYLKMVVQISKSSFRPTKPISLICLYFLWERKEMQQSITRH